MAIIQVLTHASGGPDEAAFIGGSPQWVPARANFHCDYELQIVKPAGATTHYIRPGALSPNGIPQQHASVTNNFTMFAFAPELLPASGAEEFFAVWAGTGAYKAHLRVSSTGIVTVYDTTDTLLGTSSVALSAGSTYFIGVNTGRGTSASWVVRIYDASMNLLEELSGTGNLVEASHGGPYLGNRTNRSSQAIDFRYGPLVVDDSEWPERIGAKKVALVANGSVHQWTAGTGSSGYGEIDETPANDADYIMSPASGAPNVSLFSSAAFAESVAAHRAIFLLARLLEDPGAGTSSCGLIMRHGATDVSTSPVDAMSTALSLSYLRTTQPGGGIWDANAINNTQIGVYEQNSVSTRCTAIWKIVIYTPASGGAEPPSGNLLRLHAIGES